MSISNKDLIAGGITPGKWMPEALREAQSVFASTRNIVEAIAAAKQIESKYAYASVELRAPGELGFYQNIEAQNAQEARNIEQVRACMDEIMRLPHVVSGAIMPDACPSGPATIPVGGVVASSVIHPGFHSADICCSLALSNFGATEPAAVMDAVFAATHFGPGGCDKIAMPAELKEVVASNVLTRPLASIASSHFGTQGDGNHFAYVGRLQSSGDTVLVTHHGSRGFGARLYKKGIEHAYAETRKVCPEVRKQNAWLELDEFGQTYWEALQVVREWTRQNHFAIHDHTAATLRCDVQDRYWNEHNFVFQKQSDGLFYHAKGATPAWDNWAADATAHTLIPLNMAQPILVVSGNDAANGLGFSPHGAGRNMSRTAHKKANASRTVAEIFAEETQGIDCRFFSGETDISELPSAYKDAASVKAQISQFGLADIVDEVVPYGSIMAGDWQVNAPWRNKRSRK